jgi:fibronectin type 3 domain-containing protein
MRDAVSLSFSSTFTPDSNHWLGRAPAGEDVMVTNYVVYRSDKAGDNFTALGAAQGGGHGKLIFRDTGFEWQTTYVYKIAPVTRYSGGVEVVGADSPTVEVFTHDSFPPAAPEGLQAVSSGTAREKFIDLTWAPNTESDLAGHHVYRRQQAGDWVRITKDLITTPAFRDSDVTPGRTYYYAVSAVDLRRNESAKSEEAGETVH